MDRALGSSSECQMLIIGINPGSHDSAACAVVDGVIVAAAEEERFTRRKHALGEMPWNATLYCLRQVGSHLGEVDYIATCWKGPDQLPHSVQVYGESHVQKHKDYYYGKLFPEALFGDTTLPPIVHVSHHLAHAASAYRCSAFEEAAVLVVDGQGDGESTTVAHGIKGKIQCLTRFGIEQSLGYFYQAVTDYLGLGELGGEGKTMGLAAYGNPRFDFPEFSLQDDGYHLAVPPAAEAEASRSMLRFWRCYLESRFGKRSERSAFPDPYSRVTNLSDSDRLAWDIAASAQAQVESVLVHLAKLALRWTSSNNLVLSGGVALNCAANGKIADETGANVFVFPAAGDAGAAVGAALELSAELGIAQGAFHDPFLGPSFSDEHIENILTQSNTPYSFCSNPATKAAELIAEGRIVAWFQGELELGPRALGHRSILADPRSTAMRDRVNAVKNREPWRPLAPSIPKEEARQILGSHVDSPFMLKAVSVPKSGRKRILGTVHVDATARVHTVERSSNPLYHRLLLESWRCLGVPAVINTSFNEASEPMVCTPRDALRTFWGSSLDCLVLGSFIIGPKDRFPSTT